MMISKKTIEHIAKTHHSVMRIFKKNTEINFFWQFEADFLLLTAYVFH